MTEPESSITFRIGVTIQMRRGLVMKTKGLLVVVALLISAAFAGTVYAQAGRGGGKITPDEVFQQKMGAAKTLAFEGILLSHDVACHCVVVKTADGNLTLQDDYAEFDQEYDRAKGLPI